MNKRLQGFVAGILCCVLFASISVFAKNTSETIQALYKDIKIYVDGVKIDPKDANGNTVEPFIYNGTTYLPVRAVGEAINKQVTWDGATSSVYLGDVPGVQTNWMNQVLPYRFSSNTSKTYLSSKGEFFEMGGKKYTDGIALGTLNHNVADRQYYVLYNLDGKYNKLKVKIGPIDNEGREDTTINFYADDKLIKSVDIKKDALPKIIEIPLNYAMQLKIEKPNSWGYYGFTEGHFE